MAVTAGMAENDRRFRQLCSKFRLNLPKYGNTRSSLAHQAEPDASVIVPPTRQKCFVCSSQADLGGRVGRIMGLHGRVAVRALCAEHAGRDVCSPFPATVVGASVRLRSLRSWWCCWGQRTIWSRGHFRDRLRVVCGRECLAAATGITRLTRGGQNARSYRLEVRVYVLLGGYSFRGHAALHRCCARDGLVALIRR